VFTRRREGAEVLRLARLSRVCESVRASLQPWKRLRFVCDGAANEPSPRLRASA